ncbi:primosomal replication protein [Haemophilus influenzae]|uniref:Primosomal replication protein N n=1 Tax=Haemophilus influenzae TaxID=727 RepID=A0A0D0IJ38_HAEIF|nr:primosomal replication protein PriC [Haemophilus influenzae]EDK10301.1 predicted primosomal replication protein N [Haemophilus influenzae PittHH]KIP37173.1 ribonuclease T [Haemophilus influenzae]KIP48350.1 ribonuclease T [Haemophilus influenzae]KIS36333.1 primosomal replication protein N'' [Haemophilus influenzae]KMZ32845.1 ribonuclease T [Haemophilus influenzae]
MTVQQLIQRLDQKVQQLYQSNLPQEEKIFAKFDRTLFSENGQTVAFYLKEINQTLDQIKSLQSENPDHYIFITKRLLAQCTALSEALTHKNKPFIINTNSIPPQSQKKSQHSIHKLPPRERLEKYYEAREQLNNLYRQHKDLAQAEKNNDEKIRYAQLAEVYKKRQQKCQDAIDLLEEYLVFKEEVENRENTENK